MPALCDSGQPIETICGRLSTRRTFVRQLLNSVRRIRGHLAGWDELAGSAGVAMNSMLEDVLAREGSAPAFEDSRVDAELEEMLSKMRTNIKIIGLGGGGCNTIGRVYNEGIVGAELFACNTDAQHLLHIAFPKKDLLGRRITKGLGAGALPQIGEEAAREAEEELRAIVQGADIVFVTCGLGGVTGICRSGSLTR